MRKVVLLASLLPLYGQVKITQGPDKISIDIDGHPFTDFVIGGEDYAKPYLAPLRAASGTVVTRYWPMDKSHAGETKDHPHHRGLWFGQDEVNGFNFWANEPTVNQKNPGKQIVKNVKIKSGNQTGTIQCDIEWTGGGNVLMVEHRTMTFYSGEAAGPQNRQIDFDLTLEPKTKVVFGDTKEGTFSLRLAPWLEYPQKRAPQEPKRTGTMVNAQGNKGEDDDWGKKSEWMDYYGETNGEKLGIAMFDNPKNPGFPNRWHTRGYGLFGINLFGLHDFDKSAPGPGGLTLEPGHNLHYRFRVLIHPGDYQTAKIADEYKKWAGQRTTGYLGNIRQLTEGGSNAEAYWSPDGKRLIFQSTRPPYDCDQIFIMNADGGNPHLVSTGKGRTTCAYFLADNRHIIYASTHEADEKCPAPPDRSKGYLWGVFAGYEIFLATDDGKIEKKLTNAPGYDAEGTVNWKTGRIVYTSLASGDLDLWSMATDGSHKQRLTSREGYDGGAVFSHDGKKLVWRANYPKSDEEMARYRSLLKENLTAPMKMELVVADADGTNAKVITDFGCASFAPTFTPDDRHILFASNKHNCDGRKFELFMINPDGSGLTQVTDFGGFTSFPEFSPDGKRLVFCSDKGAKSRYEFNIFVADWREQAD